MPIFPIFGEHLLRWNSIAFLFSPLPPLPSSSSPFLHLYFSFNVRCKDIGFQSVTLTFISDARVRQTPWGLPTLFTCCVSCAHRTSHVLAIIAFKFTSSNGNSIFTYYFIFMGANTFGNDAVVSSHQATE